MRAQASIAWLAVVSLAVAIAVTTDRQGGEGHLVQGCVPTGHEGRSIARVWNDVALDAIRRDVPAPTVHARNLFHLSAAMWDAWTAYDQVGDGYVVDERLESGDVQAAREAAISYAAYRVLLSRYQHAAGLQATFDQLTDTMGELCYRIDVVDTDGTSPAALGNRIAATILEAAEDDGSLEGRRYVDESYQPVNDPLVVADPGTVMRDPNRWQPLALSEQIAQNGVPIPGNVQTFIGPHWGYVTPFALSPSPDGVPLDPGPPPHLDDPDGGRAFRQAAVDVVAYSATLDPAEKKTVDIGPGSRGDNSLGANDGDGHAVNPATGLPYPPNQALAADYGRVIAEFWADGPDSETPPGHWNTIANHVTDSPGFERRLGGRGAVLEPLEWDVKMYFALNGALHDAAIAAWGAKGFYDSVRPISMIRYLGGNGQASDALGPTYDPDGLPLVPGLIEVVTSETAAPGERHQDLAGYEGEVAVWSWRGSPDDPDGEVGGVGWIRAVEWVPYQRPDFVSPAFAGYVSGHSTFSRAGAEVLTAITGSPFFPGGMASWTIPAGSLRHEDGPTRDVTLQWATYADAADEAGISRLYGGIHIGQDDLAGRVMGYEAGTAAWALAIRYFEGTARP